MGLFHFKYHSVERFKSWHEQNIALSCRFYAGAFGADFVFGLFSQTPPEVGRLRKYNCLKEEGDD